MVFIHFDIMPANYGTCCRIMSVCPLLLLPSKMHYKLSIWKMNFVLFVTNIKFLNYLYIILIIIHQTHYEKSDWSRAFNQLTIACELAMINVISAADITFIMSSSTSAWLLSP